MGNYSNNTGVSLPLAVWLATDDYDGKPGTNPHQISATSLLKSVRQIVLGMRVDPSKETIDVGDIIKSKIGNALHDHIEKAWTGGKLHDVITSLGYPKDLADRVVVNPNLYQGVQHPANLIPIYMEQRAYKNVGKWTLTGKYDFIMDGHLHDFKSTTTFTYVNDTKTDDYIKQGSMYRWLNPDKITDNEMTIDFIFTDWKAGQVDQKNYPPAQVMAKRYELMAPPVTETWVKSRLDLIESYELSPEPELPFCTDAELWRSDSTWKYYSSGLKTARSTKNYDNAAEAYARKNTDGNKGLVLEVKGQPTACLYCNVSSKCSQKSMFVANGDLPI